jgi:hypothetical protein
MVLTDLCATHTTEPSSTYFLQAPHRLYALLARRACLLGMYDHPVTMRVLTNQGRHPHLSGPRAQRATTKIGVDLTDLAAGTDDAESQRLSLLGGRYGRVLFGAPSHLRVPACSCPESEAIIRS